MNALMNIGGTAAALTMSSREIAELTGSTHDNVLKTVRRLISEGVVLGNETPYIHPQNGQTYMEFRMSFRDTMVVVSGYSAELRARIIDRWQQLEEEARQQYAVPKNMAEALRLAADLVEQKQLAEMQRDEAIATKALIGHKREATAMNTASQAIKKAARLEVELDKAMQYATVKRMEMLYHGQKFNWRLLKSTATQMDMPPIDVFDSNYGTVKAYHADVWREAYALEIASIEA